MSINSARTPDHELPDTVELTTRSSPAPSGGRRAPWRTIRSGDTAHGLAAGLYPTDQPVLPETAATGEERP